MEKIEWNSSYSVGNKLLDNQHKEILGMINLLVADIDATTCSESVSETLTRLTHYASEHFKTEERLLEEIGYPEIQQQKEQHKKYRLKIGEFCQKTMAKQDSVSIELLQFIHGWWDHHIQKVDMKYGVFLEECGVS